MVVGSYNAIYSDYELPEGMQRLEGVKPEHTRWKLKGEKD